MTSSILIRDETTTDVSAIREVTIAAFQTLAISNHTEHLIVEALRAADALTVSLVAVMDGAIVGHIAFSPVVISDGSEGWYGLGPLSVLPTYQRQGIGKALVQAGLSRLRDLSAQGCCLVGHPEYYPQFGFATTSELRYEGVPPEFFFVLSLGGPIPRGTVAFHDSFGVEGEPSD